MTFFRGQRVVCVDASPSWIGVPCDLIKGAIYQVAGVDEVPDPAGNCGLLIEGHGWEDSLHCAAYRASRFRPVVEGETDISALQALLNPAKQTERA